MSTHIGRSGAIGAGEDRNAANSSLSIRVFDSLGAAEADWRRLLDVATVSPYQTYEIQAAWFETIGRSLGLEPFIVVARDAADRAVALLPLAITTNGMLRIARFIGNRESNFNIGLFAEGLHERRAARRLLSEAARYAPAPPDLYYLSNMPRCFDGVDNPLAFEEAPDSASFAYGAALPGATDELTARLSKDARKKLRKKEARLAEMGTLTYAHCVTGERARVVLESLIAQKSTRLADMGVTQLSAQPGMRAFLERVTDEGMLELHALALNNRIIAVYAGFTRDGRFSGMLNSFDMDDEIARSSPGDLLLHALMRNLVARGMTRFDLGAGEARYKRAVCDETIVLCDAVVPVNIKGAVAAPILTRALQIKRRIKQSPALSRALARWRRLHA